MASDLNFVEYVCDQARNAGQVSFKKMFGEYAIYLDFVSRLFKGTFSELPEPKSKKRAVRGVTK